MPKKMSRSEVDKKMIQEKTKVHSKAREKFGTPKCKKGEILREGYLKKNSKSKSGSKSWIRPTCIQSRTGKPHGKQLFVLEKGVLSKYGYENVKNMSRQKRHIALNKVLKKSTSLSLFRRLNALAILNKDQDPGLSKIFKDDANWIQSTSAYQNRPTSKKGSKRGSKRGSKK